MYSKQPHEQERCLLPSLWLLNFICSFAGISCPGSDEPGQDPDGLWSIFWKDTVKPLPVISNRASGSHLSVITSFHVTRPDLIDLDKVGNISQYVVFCFQNIKVNNAIIKTILRVSLIQTHIFPCVLYNLYF